MENICYFFNEILEYIKIASTQNFDTVLEYHTRNLRHEGVEIGHQNGHFGISQFLKLTMP